MVGPKRCYLHGASVSPENSEAGSKKPLLSRDIRVDWDLRKGTGWPRTGSVGPFFLGRALMQSDLRRGNERNHPPRIALKEL